MVPPGLSSEYKGWCIASIINLSGYVPIMSFSAVIISSSVLKSQLDSTPGFSFCCSHHWLSINTSTTLSPTCTSIGPGQPFGGSICTLGNCSLSIYFHSFCTCERPPGLPCFHSRLPGTKNAFAFLPCTNDNS